ncbi:MAG: hypothetical protein ACYDAY_11725 [Candidatus Dormibacteria bacterium]
MASALGASQVPAFASNGVPCPGICDSCFIAGVASAGTPSTPDSVTYGGTAACDLGDIITGFNVLLIDPALGEIDQTGPNTLQDNLPCELSLCTGGAAVSQIRTYFNPAECGRILFTQGVLYFNDQFNGGASTNLDGPRVPTIEACA